MSFFTQVLERLEKYGWVKGNRESPDGRCLAGAFVEKNCGQIAEYKYPEKCKQLANLIKISYEDRLGYDEYNHTTIDSGSPDIAVICCFNNHRDTKFEDVKNLLTAAIKYESKRNRKQNMENKSSHYRRDNIRHRSLL